MINQEDIYNLKKLKIYSKAIKVSEKAKIKLMACTLATTLTIMTIPTGITLSLYNSNDSLVYTMIEKNNLYTNETEKDNFYMPIINGEKLVFDYHDDLNKYNIDCNMIDKIPLKAIVLETGFKKINDQVYSKTIDTYYLNKDIDLNNFDINNLDAIKDTKIIRKVGVSFEDLLEPDKLSYIIVDQDGNNTKRSINSLAFGLAVTLFLSTILIDISKKNNNKYIELYDSLNIEYNYKDIKEAYNKLLKNTYNDKYLLNYIKLLYSLQDKGYFKKLLYKLKEQKRLIFVKKLVKKS